ncbi:biosynthetic-type acetolactate synthase large subunit [uncultured Mailhella sp.]|uniref:biosynthetic-type acetolactate synthase large subunit n=1 Tax=uncultured Mailhella sp. TaxID=1981031 RepID=UPI0025E4D653|nr:biosynthetic-type acetolactate synthase large subunit [uncultured Mailhella sp.]
MKLTGSEIFCEVLVEQGVDTLFGYPGGAVLNLYDALYKYQDRIRHIITAHEQGAAHAADGYARATGRTGVVLVTSGPGATNLVTGIATAYMDSVPMVAITGNVPTPLIGQDSFQEVYIAGITMPITKHNFVVDRVEDLADILREAFRIAQTGRKGPVLVDIPKDMTSAVAEFVPAAPVRDAYTSHIDMDAIDKAADIINNAQRPAIYYGGGVISSGASAELAALMKKTCMPGAYTLMAAGVIDSDDPLNLGMVGMHGCRTSNFALDYADVMVAVGTRFSDRVALAPDAFGRRAKLIQIDIDPSEVNKNVGVDVSLMGDVKDIICALLPKLHQTCRDEWLAQIAEWKQEDYHPEDSDTTLKPHQVIRKVNEMAGNDAIYVTDVGQHQMWAAQYLHHVKPRHFLTSGGLGTMGFGYGAAIGAKIAKPEKRVVLFTGDGSFHMNMNEACTAVSFGVPVITVILDNHVLGMVRQWQTSFYGKRYSCTDLNRRTDYVKVIEGFGGKGYHCDTLADLEKAMAEALQSDVPVWIHCCIDKDEKVLPMIPGGCTCDSIIME